MYTTTVGIEFPAPSVARILAGGYVLRPGTQSLFTHSRYPGWLFKMVPDIESALSCGGIMVDGGGGTRIAYLGSTAMNNASKGLLGSWTKMTQELPVPMGLVQRLDDSNVTQAWAEVGVVITTPSQVVGSFPDSFFLGVITKASCGFLVDRAISTEAIGLVPNFTRTTRKGSIPFTGSYTGSPVLTGRLFDDRLVAANPFVTGFIRYNWNIGKKDWLARARGPLAAAIPEEPIRALYDTALTELVAETPADAMVTDGVHFTFGLVGTKIHVCASPRTGILDLQARTASFAALTGTVRSAPAQGPFPNIVQTVTRVRAYFPSDCFIADGALAGSICPAVTVADVNGYDGPGATGPSVWVLAGKNGTGAVNSQRPFFSPLACPYKAVRLIQTAEVPMSGIFAALFPASGPASLTFEGMTVLDLTDRVDEELNSPTPGRPLTAGPTSTPSEISTAANFALQEVMGNELALRETLRLMSPFTNFVAGSVMTLDAKVRLKV